MEPDGLIEVAQQGLYLLVLLVGPPVGAAVVAGLAVSVVQTATQVQEQTIGFAVRAGAVVAALMLAGPWMGAQLSAFTATVFALIGAVGGS